MLFQTTAAHEELRAKIRNFAEEEIKPLAFLMDQNNEFPEEAVKKLGKLGWMGIPYPKEYGGAGLDEFGLIAVLGLDVFQHACQISIHNNCLLKFYSSVFWGTFDGPYSIAFDDNTDSGISQEETDEFSGER